VIDRDCYSEFDEAQFPKPAHVLSVRTEGVCMAERARARALVPVFGLFILSAVAYLDRVNISIAGSSIAASII